MKRVFLTLVLILISTVVASAKTIFYFPHVVNGVQGSVTWKTTILLTNPASSGTASGVISLSADNSNLSAAGSPLTVTMTDENGQSATASNFTFSIPANGTRRLISDGAGQFASGFATVIPNVGRVS